MTDRHDSPNPTRMPIPWFDNPSIQRDLAEASYKAEQVARSKGAESRDLMLFHLQQAAALAGCEVWELHETLRKAGMAASAAPGEA